MRSKCVENEFKMHLKSLTLCVRRRKNDGLICVGFLPILVMPKALSGTEAARKIKRRVFHKAMSELWRPLLAFTDRCLPLPSQRFLLKHAVDDIVLHSIRPFTATLADGTTKQVVIPLGPGITDWPENNLVHNSKDGATKKPCNLCHASM